MTYRDYADYVSGDGKRLVHVERDLEGLTPSPREITDANVGTFLTWHRTYSSPDENRWDSAADWIAAMLDERLTDREMLDAIAAGRVDGLRVVEREDDGFCCGPVTVVQSYVSRSWAPGKPFWDDAVVLDARDLEMIGAGRDWCGDSLAEAVAPRPESLDLLGEAGMVVLPVYMLEHSGVCYSTRDFRDPWDSGLVGFISTTQERVAELFGEGCSVDQEVVVDAMREEVEEYDAWTDADVYTVDVLDEHGKLLVSHGPYYDHDFDRADAAAVSDIVGFDVVAVGAAVAA